MASRVEKLTPKKAQKLLDNRAANRNIGRRNVDKLKDAIRNREWDLNGESIKVNVNGQMEDGQHRCLAVVETGITIDTYVVRGLPVGVFDTIDTNYARKAFHVLQKHGEVNTRALAASVVLLHRFKEGKMKDAWQVFSHKQCLEYLEQHPGLRDSVSIAGKARKYLPQSVGAVFYHEASQIDPDLAAHFMDRIADGDQLKHGSPIWKLRHRLEDNRAAKAKLRSPDLLALCILAWNATRDGRSLRALVWKSASNFPELH